MELSPLHAADRRKSPGFGEDHLYKRRLGEQRRNDTMKICPFLSHMLVDDHSSTLTIDRTANSSEESERAKVVILGYDNGQSASAQTTSATMTDSAGEVSPHLQCLKDPCRFYKQDTGDCQFDLIFSIMKDGQESSKDDVADMLTMDIEKIWKFQTKSVSELVKSICDTEKKQSNALSNFKKEIERDLKSIASKVNIPDMSSMKQTLDALKKRLEDRDGGIKDMSSVVSQVVLNLEEGMSKLNKRSENLIKDVDKLKQSIPSEKTIRTLVEESLTAKIGKIEIPDLNQQICSIEKSLEESKKSRDSSSAEVNKKLEASLSSHKSLEEKISSSWERIEKQIKDLGSQQQKWEDRLTQLSERQSDLTGLLEDSKKHHEDEKSRQKIKQAKKYNNLGVTSFHNGAFELARDQFEQAVKLDPEFAEAYNNLGLSNTELGDDEKATNAFARAVEIDPNLPAAYNNLGYIFYKKGSYEKAIEMYNEALGRSTDNSSAHTNLGNAYYKLNKFEQAREAWSKSLEIDPGNEKAKRNLKRLDEMKQ
jgi:tetratricopeptide (TPR) repeat protein